MYFFLKKKNSWDNGTMNKINISLRGQATYGCYLQVKVEWKTLPLQGVFFPFIFLYQSKIFLICVIHVRYYFLGKNQLY